MNTAKRPLFSGPEVLGALLAVMFVPSFSRAATNCDNQPKPAIGCPTGYTLMCNPTGGDHWSCGKDSRSEVSTGTSGSVNVDVDASDAEMSAGVRADSETSVESGGGRGESDRAILQRNETDVEFLRRSADSDADVEDDSGDGAESMSDDNDVEADAAVIRKVEVRGWDPKKKEEFLLTVKAAVEVRSGQELENFARGILLRDEQIELIKASDSGVVVSYRVPAKLFGIFSASVRTDVSADAEGKVKVRFPWYRVFYNVLDEFESSSLESEIESETSAVVSENDPARASLTIQLVSNILKTKHDTVKNSINNIR